MSERINREYKDRLFSFIFGREENKAWTLSLYNALNETDYTDVNAIEITTMSDTVYMGMRNDVSCIVSDTVSLYEQQSTYNPNMPVRQLMYLGRQYDKYIEDTEQNIYGSRQLRLPIPKLVTFYNGTDDIEDRILRLSDSFTGNADQSDVHVNVRLININSGTNRKILESCRPLGEYSWFVDTIRKKISTENTTMEDAVYSTISEMPKEYQIKKFLMKNRAEVKNMCLTEYDEAKTMEMFKRDAREEGQEYKLVEQICKKLRKGKSVEQIADEVEEDIENVQVICSVAEAFAPDYVVEKVLEKMHKR